MNLISSALMAGAMALSSAACLAQAAAPTPAKAVTSAPKAPGAPNAPKATAPAIDESAGSNEPRVQQTVVEDDGARIDELKVRGHTQRIVVSPKRGGAAPYEIITGDGSRDLGDGANTSRGAAGKRVWNVLKF
jgi:hypothetical protein